MSSLQSYSVLVADDDSRCRESVRALLEQQGMQTFTAVGGVEALDFVQERSVHLVILDQWMPDLTGIETLKRITEIKQQIPSIIMSGESTNETKLEAMNAGAYAFISKPIQSGIMKHAVQQAIDRYYLKTKRRQ